MYYGVGGIGKSRLQTHLMERLGRRANKYLLARLDFEDDGLALSPLQALDALRFQLRKDYKVSFNTYDIAYLIYWKKANPRIKLEDQSLKIFEHSDIPIGIAEATLDLATFGLVSNTGKLLEKSVPAVKKWWMERGNQELAVLNRMEKPSEIARALPYFLALDIQDYLQKHPDQQAVFFLDTYEKLIGDKRSEKAWRDYDNWVRSLVSELPQAVWVLGGREKLRWEELHASEEWKGQVEQHLVGDLSETDARSFLSSCNIEQPDIVERILASYAGSPFFLNLMVDIYHEVARTRTPEAGDFPERHEEVYYCFLRHITQDETDTFKILSCLQICDDELLSTLLKEFNSAYNSPSATKQVTRFSFVTANQANNSFTMHQLMQRHLYGKLTEDDPSLVGRIHGFVFSILKQRLTKIDAVEERKTIILRGVHHALRSLHPEEVYQWAKQHVELLDEAIHFDFYLEAYHPIYKALENDDSHQELQADCLNQLGLSLYKKGLYVEAEAFVNKALTIRQKVLGERHLATAQSLNNLGLLLKVQDKFDEAESLYRDSLEIRIDILGEKHAEVAQSQSNLAELLRHIGKYEEAELLHRKALKIKRKVLGNWHLSTAKSLNNLGLVLKDQGKYREAEPFYRYSLVIRKRILGDRHPSTAIALNNLSGLLESQNKYSEAEPICRQAYEIYYEMLGENHPISQGILINWQYLLRKMKEELD